MLWSSASAGLPSGCIDGGVADTSCRPFVTILRVCRATAYDTKTRPVAGGRRAWHPKLAKRCPDHMRKAYGAVIRSPECFWHWYRRVASGDAPLFRRLMPTYMRVGLSASVATAIGDAVAPDGFARSPEAGGRRHADTRHDGMLRIALASIGGIRRRALIMWPARRA